MNKICYVEKALASADPFAIYLECMDDVKSVVGETLGAHYLPIDLPIICAGLKLLTAALEMHPLVGEAGRAVEKNILDHCQVINTSGMAGLTDMDPRKGGGNNVS